jgi:hypothetical protein
MEMDLGNAGELGLVLSLHPDRVGSTSDLGPVDAKSPSGPDAMASCDKSSKRARTRNRDRTPRHPTRPLDWPDYAGIVGERRSGGSTETSDTRLSMA